MDSFFIDVVNKVISNYPLEVKKNSLEFVEGKEDGWSIDTNVGEVVLKKIVIDEENIRFMIHAIDFLRDHGVFTPEVLTTKLGECYVRIEDEYFMVFEAINGRLPDFENEDDIMMIMNGIAAFHKSSLGIEFTNDQLKSSRSEWKNDLQNKILKLTKWKEEHSKVKQPNEIDKLFLKNINTILMQCEKAIALIDKYTKVIEESKTLCYQDLDIKNLIIGEDENLYLLDMCSITLGLPIHDMRRILNTVMKYEKAWNLKLMKKMMIAYQEVNPLSPIQLNYLKADLMFPHLFYEIYSVHYENKKNICMNTRDIFNIKKIISIELSKEKVVNTLFAKDDGVLNN